jgi:hypothetical protein
MKLALALLATYATTTLATTSISEVKADSKFGMDLLSKARRADENGDDEADATWVSGFALKFQGCHHISQWNPEAGDDEDAVRVESKRLARFRLCPVDSCSGDSARGCSSKYGDYIIDMDIFLQTYLENKAEVEEANCEYHAQYNCNCVDNGDDAYDEEKCEYDCFKNAGMTECYEEKYYNAYGYEEEMPENMKGIDVQDYLECAGFDYDAGDDANGRKLEDEGDEYFIGPYCSDSGGKIVIGMFTDDACTNFADDYGGRETYKTMTGLSLTNSQTSIVDTACYTCGQAENGYYETKKACETLYESAGKCESALYSTLGSNTNENACTYMEGIKVTSSNHIIMSGARTSNKVASAFIGIFSVSFVLLGSYVYYLKTKLDRGSINLSD